MLGCAMIVESTVKAHVLVLVPISGGSVVMIERLAVMASLAIEFRVSVMVSTSAE